MRTLLATAALAFFADPVFAADLGASRAPTLPPAATWSGFYAGLNVGGGVSTSNNVTTTGYAAYDWAAGAYNLPPGWTSAYRAGNANVEQAGVIGGGQLGYNYQFNPRMVIGLETDFQGSSIGGSGSTLGLAGGAGNTGHPAEDFLHLQSGVVNASAGVEWMGTVRGRIGFLATPTMLVFATGGFAYGNTYARVSSAGYHWHPGNEIAHPENPVTPSWDSISATRAGWTVGGGAEWMFMQNWSAKVEALYYDLGAQSAHGQFSPLINPAAPGSIAIVNGATTTFNYEGVIARVGLNHHLNWGASAPLVAQE